MGHRISILLLSAGLLIAAGPDLSGPKYRLGHLYSGNGHFREDIIFTVKSGRISGSAVNSGKLPSGSVDLKRFWALPLLQQPFRTISIQPEDSTQKIIFTAFWLDAGILDSLSQTSPAEVGTCYLHVSDIPGCLSTVLAYDICEAQMTSPMLTLHSGSSTLFTDAMRTVSRYALYDSRHDDPHYTPDIFRNSAFKSLTADLQNSNSLRLCSEERTEIPKFPGTTLLHVQQVQDPPAVSSDDPLTWYLFPDIRAYCAAADSIQELSSLKQVLIRFTLKILPEIPKPVLIFRYGSMDR